MRVSGWSAAVARHARAAGRCHRGARPRLRWRGAVGVGRAWRHRRGRRRPGQGRRLDPLLGPRRQPRDPLYGPAEDFATRQREREIWREIDNDCDASQSPARRARYRGLCARQKHRARASPRSSSCRRTRRRSGRARTRSRPTRPAPTSGGLSGRLGERVARGDRPRLRARSRPHRLRRRLRRFAAICWRMPICRRRRGDPHHARLSGLSDRDAWHRRDPSSRRKRILPPTSMRSCNGDGADQDRLPRQPQQPDRHLSSLRRGQTAAPRPAAACAVGARRGLRRICPANDYEVGIELVATTENVGHDPHLFQDPWSGGAAARLDVRPGPYRRRGQPHPRSVQRIDAGDAAGIAAIEDTAHQQTCARHFTRNGSTG